MAFVDNLRALMSAKGVSRRKMASDCGISPSAVNSWFNRSAENISLPTLLKLSEYFGVSIEELVHGTPQREITFSNRIFTDEELEEIQLFAQFLLHRRKD
jgi:transcriptional regulator with XRE-family HTH domain